MSSTFALDYTCLVDDHGGPIRLRIPLRIPLVSTPVSRRDENAQQQQLLWVQSTPVSRRDENAQQQQLLWTEVDAATRCLELLSSDHASLRISSALQPSSGFLDYASSPSASSEATRAVSSNAFGTPPRPPSSSSILRKPSRQLRPRRHLCAAGSHAVNDPSSPTPYDTVSLCIAFDLTSFGTFKRNCAPELRQDFGLRLIDDHDPRAFQQPRAVKATPLRA
ncbi:hypothetical protein B0H14DRAFT_3866566 [Mycena olivaceomarginata]|nr:hypothetical protein B0H14DRAFT_3866566 [Mycena olivaceomarginata]